MTLDRLEEYEPIPIQNEGAHIFHFNVKLYQDSIDDQKTFPNVDTDIPLQIYNSNLTDSLGGIAGVDKDTANFFLLVHQSAIFFFREHGRILRLLLVIPRYTRRLLLNSATAQLDFDNLFPNSTFATKAAVAQAFVNTLSRDLVTLPSNLCIFLFT
jgi:hypothetical protein